MALFQFPTYNKNLSTHWTLELTLAKLTVFGLCLCSYCPNMSYNFNFGCLVLLQRPPLSMWLFDQIKPVDDNLRFFYLSLTEWDLQRYYGG